MRGTVEVAYTARRGLASALVRDLGSGPSGRAWSHCALVLPDRTGVVESLALRGGVVRTPWPEFLAHNAHVCVVAFDVPDAAAVFTHADADMGRRYDWFGAAGAYFRRPWHRDAARHCVHVAEGALHAGGCRRWVAPPHAIRPNDSYSNAGGRVGEEKIK